jgi:hypothetical protein
MAVLEVSPAQAGQSPEAPGTLQFFEQGQDPSTGFQVTSRGQILASVAAAYTGATAGTDVFTSKVSGDVGNRFVINADGKLEWGDGTGALDVNLYRPSPGVLKSDQFFNAAAMQSDGDVSMYGSNFTLGTAGGRLRLKEGAGASVMGRATLVAGTVTVNTTSVSAASEIFLTCQTPGGTPGFLRVSARTAGTSFTILSSSGTDTSVVGWVIVEPAP